MRPKCKRSWMVSNNFEEEVTVTSVDGKPKKGLRRELKRIILKLSGEALCGDRSFGIGLDIVENLAIELQAVRKLGIEIGIVVGGGNFFRGAGLKDQRISRITADQMGMMATVINALAMVDVFNHLGVTSRILSAVGIDGVAERYDRRRADEYLSSGTIVVFAAGTGNPLATTDSALCLRGIELSADLLLKATKVHGVYSHDPQLVSDAQFYPEISYDEALKQDLRVMDLAAFTLGREHNKKLVVFNLSKRGAILNLVKGLQEGTVIQNR